MKNTIYHRTAPVIPPDMAAEAQKAIQEIAGNLNLMPRLTREERKSINTVNVRNKAFTEDALQVGGSHSDIVPDYIPVASLQELLVGYDQADKLTEAVGELYEQLRDNRRVIGANAYSIALSLYRFFDGARKDGVAGAEGAY